MIIPLFSLLSTIFTAAAVILLLVNMIHKRFSRGMQVTMTLSVLLYLFINISNFLEHSGISDIFDPIEDIADVVFILLLLFFFYSYRAMLSFTAIKNKEQWLTSSFEALEEGVITSDENLNILFVNKKLEKICGIKKTDVIGKPTHQILQFIDKKTGEPVDYDPFALALQGDFTEKYPSGILLKGSETNTLVTVNTSLIRNNENCIMGVVTGFHDVGSYYSMMEQLNHTHKMEALGQLAGGVAHDLNNMLGGILGAVEVMKYTAEDINSRENEELLNIILNSANNAKELTANLLSFGRKGKIISTAVVLQDIINKTVAIAERTVEKDIHFNVYLHPEDLYVVGDPGQLQNALLNLVLNARDAVVDCEKKEISITAAPYVSSDSAAEPSDKQIEISVRDTGEGISPAILEHIFDPFFTTKDEGKGTGLGLSAVQSTIHSHHGEIKVSSNPGTGTCFHVFLPSVEGAGLREKAPYTVTSEKEIKKQILIVDDDTLIQSTIRHMLLENNYSAISCESGQSAVSLFKDQNKAISAVIIDMVLPDMSGLDVQSKLNQIKAGIPVILTSGFAYDEKYLPVNALFLQKPFTMHDFFECLNKCFQG